MDRRPVFHISARRSLNLVTAGPWHFTMNSLVLIRPLIHMDRPSVDQAILVSFDIRLLYETSFYSVRFVFTGKDRKREEKKMSFAIGDFIFVVSVTRSINDAVVGRSLKEFRNNRR